VVLSLKNNTVTWKKRNTKFMKKDKTKEEKSGRQ
jgi:hypothetical protein